jgi:dTDP-glucose 4,6-dehydratase
VFVWLVSLAKQTHKTMCGFTLKEPCKVDDMQDFWLDKNILVTGAGGFIASHLCEALVEQGAKVKAFTHYNSRGDPGLLSLLPKDIYSKIEIVTGDLLDLPTVTNSMKDIDIVFHLGALISIPYSYSHPVQVVETNVLGTLNVLMAGKENGVERIIHTSSSEVYGTALRAPIDEDHPLQGQSPYSASKIGADKIAESFHLSYDLPVVTLRPFNTYGPRQSSRAIIPSIIIQSLTGDTLSLGNLNTYRDLTYVSDTVNGFLCAAQTPNIEGETINLGVGKEIQMKVLVDEIISIINKPVEIKIDPARIRPEKSEVMRLISDNRRAREIMGWEPETNLRDGLTKTINWFDENLDIVRHQIYIF